MESSPEGHRAPALWILLPLMAGLVVGRQQWLPLEPVWLLVGALAASCAALLVPRVWAPGLVLGLLLLGAAHYALARARIAAWEELPPREARLTVQIDRIFPASSDLRRTSGLGRITAADPHLQELIGQRLSFSLASATGEPPARAAEVSVIGVLQLLPYDPPSDSFDAYLAGAGINFRLGRGRILETVRTPSAYHRFCTAALSRFETILSHGLTDKPQPGGIFRAMLLGQKHELSSEQGDRFMHSGTMHLFAISGLHISAIALCLNVLLSLIRMPRVWQFGLATLALWLFTDITGGMPSAVRAFIMTTVLSASIVLRVPGNPLSALAFSAVLVLTGDPMQLFSASFQLSYGIMTALLILGLPLAGHWSSAQRLFTALPEAAKTRWHHTTARSWDKVSSALALGLAATVVSTLSSIAFFNLVTPGALLANLVLIPLALAVVCAGFASLLTGLAGLTGLSVVFNHAAALVLVLIEKTVELFVLLPGSHQTAAYRGDWVGPVSIALLVGVMIHGYARRWEGPAGGFWPPFAFVALVLTFGVRFG